MVLRAAINLGRRGGGARALGEAGAQLGEDLGNKLESAVKNSFDLALKPVIDVLTVMGASIAILTFKFVKGIYDFFISPPKIIEGLKKTLPVGGIIDPLIRIIDKIFPDKTKEGFDSIIDSAEDAGDATGELAESVDENFKNILDIGVAKLEELRDNTDSKLGKWVINGIIKVAKFGSGTIEKLKEMNLVGFPLINAFKEKILTMLEDISNARREAFAKLSALKTQELREESAERAEELFQKIKVKDVIITKDGKIIETDPNDTIIATQSLGNFGGTKQFIFNGMVPEQVIEFVKRELGKEGFAQGRF